MIPLLWYSLLRRSSRWPFIKPGQGFFKYEPDIKSLILKGKEEEEIMKPKTLNILEILAHLAVAGVIISSVANSL